MLRKSIVTGIILLFLLSSIIPFASSNKISSNNIIYVDDDNTEGPWDGTQEHPYQHIQDGVNATSDGDTIFVFGGTYHENIIIDKSIVIKGEDINKTIILGDGINDIVTITSNNIDISNFNIENSLFIKNSKKDIACIRLSSNAGIIHNNKLYNCIYGIYLNSSSNIKISKNIIYGDNIRCYGIFLSEMCNNITISTNNISNSKHSGILLSDKSSDNVVYDNYFINNCMAIEFYNSFNNSIEENFIKDSKGVGITFWESSDNKISNNFLENCNWGLYIVDSSQNNMINNNVIKNSYDAINIMGYSHENIVTNNRIDNNSNDGIFLSESKRNYISKNIISNNTKGINVFLKSNRNIISENNFENNSIHALFYSSFFTDWKQNYWGQPRSVPYPIYGRIGPSYKIAIPWIQFDWNPVKEPYELVVRIEVGPYTQNVNDDSITIVWETNIPTTDNYVMFGETTDYEHVMQGESDCCHHEITITPSFSLGYYKVISDGMESGDFEFKLASHCYDTQEFKCVIFGDSRGTWDNYVHATEVANAVNDESPNFVIHGGDMVDDGRIQTQWDSWLTLMKPLMQNSTVFGVMGNHERKGSRYYEIFALPNNEKWYCFDYGPCHFIILDNYELWNVGSSQYEWLEEDLQTTDKPFKIICFHEPIYCSGGHSPRTDVRAVWEPLFNKYNVDLVFQSHCHYYQRTNDINGTTYIVSGGAGAPLYTPKDAWFVNNSQKTYHYCVLDVSLAMMEITFSARYVNGTTFDEFIVCPPVVS